MTGALRTLAAAYPAAYRALGAVEAWRVRQAP